MANHVIIGASLAGASAAIALRDNVGSDFSLKPTAHEPDDSRGGAIDRSGRVWALYARASGCGRIEVDRDRALHAAVGVLQHRRGAADVGITGQHGEQPILRIGQDLWIDRCTW
jgi:hypothetical protein